MQSKSIIARWKVITPLIVVFGSVVTLAVVNVQSQAQEKKAVVVTPQPENETGEAIVLNKKFAPDTKLPALEKLKAAPAAFAQQMRAEGLQVFSNDSGRCLALIKAPVLKPEEIEKGNFSNAALAALLIQAFSKEELAKRDRGYIKFENLNPAQRVLVNQVARREKMIDQNGKPTEAGMHLMVGLYPRQITRIQHQKDGKTTWHQVDVNVFPPTEAAVKAPRLLNSLLWHSWAYAGGNWGQEKVSLAAGDYKLRDLATKVSENTSWKIQIDRRLPEIQLSAVAQEVALQKILWAVMMASGLEARIFPTSKTVFLAAPDIQNVPDAQGLDSILAFQIPGSGYISPLANPAIAELLKTNEDFRSVNGEKTLAWRFADLPLLQRHLLTYDPNHSAETQSKQQNDLNNAVAFWIQGVEVSIGLFNDDFGSGGEEFFIPAL